MSYLNIPNFGVVTCLHISALQTVRDLFDDLNCTVFELQGNLVCDKVSFLRQANGDLPCPEGLEPYSWDAFMDCLWWGLADIDTSQVAILWTDAHIMLEGGLPDLLSAVSCFEQIARSVATIEQGFPRPLILHIFLLGEGINFPYFNEEV